MNNTPKEKKSSKKKDSKFVKKIKQKVYAWHRTIGIITIIPVIFWTLSGLMHPFMAHFFKPTIANERIESKPIDKTQLTLSIQQVLEKNKITEFKNFRIVSFDNSTFYQVKTVKGELIYFNTSDAKKLEDGDQKYAHWLSRYFLDDQKNPISKTDLVTEFTSQYKYINRYLPVYKTTFNRPDGMEVYVETASGKLATYNPKSRQAFIWFFDTFHNWAFIDWISNNSIRIVVMFAFLSIIFFSAISGILIYGLFWKQFKKTDSLTSKKGLRKYHRQIGIWISLFTLTFAFSGAYHATTKWNPYTLDKMVYEPVFNTKDIQTPSNAIALDWNRFENLSIITLNDSLYYRCQMALVKKKYDTSKTDSKSKWDKKENPKSETIYINTTTNKSTTNLDIEYAKFLAVYFSDGDSKPACCEMDSGTESKQTLENVPLLETKVITEFESREYGFANKRLPVIKLAYDTPEKTTYFIETSTSRLAAVIENSDVIEGYSFAIFHKFLFMDWAGKNVRDFTMVLASLIILIISVLGLVLFLKKN
ncbi:PepSY-associated transmembrane protein [Flavobacterium sp. 1]|uniref:PepSY-associated TM helix domain-containing protein n=1 Tax=Flavobacterium sp. 1 TaxID=2035200 RepID=UPI000C232A64|nr:PepSY-associated TM helix domain-containing protein [Flavobacterium sp. 1]PJJ07062.1 PepSY-associated transmembrane protein [Flavobacterium sp. 1]